MKAWFFLSEIRRSFLNVVFVISVTGTSAGKLLNIISTEPVSEQLLKYHDTLNVVYIMSGSENGILGLVEFCLCALPAAAMYAEDYQQNAVCMRVQRMRNSGYALQRVLLAVMTSAICMFLAEIVCVLVLVFGFNQELIPAVGRGGWQESMLLKQEKYGSYWFVMVGIRSLKASFYALGALTFSIFVPRRQAVIAFPLLLYYFNQYMLGRIWPFPEWLLPSMVYGDYNVEASLLGTGEWQALGFVVVYTLVMAFITWRGLVFSLQKQGIFGGMNE